MAQFAVNDGCYAQLQDVVGGATAPAYYDVFLTLGSDTYSASTTFAEIARQYYYLGDNLANAGFVDWTLDDALGATTATLGSVSLTFQSAPIPITCDGWAITYPSSLGFPDGPLMWCGSISPALTVPANTPAVYVLSGITVTLGQCAPSPPPPTLLLSDTFGGVGSSPLGSDMPQIGGPWTVLAGTIVAGNGQCSASSSGLLLLAATPQGSASVTVTVGYTAGTSVVADVVDAVAYGTPSTTYVAARAGQGQLRLVTAEGGSTTYTTSVPLSYTAGDSYTLTLEVVDQVATAYWQGQPLAAVGPTGLDVSDSVGLGFEALFGVPDSVIHSIVVTTP